MRSDFTEEQEQLRRDVREFLEQRLPDDWVGIFRDGDAAEVSFEICREMARRGWLTMHWPREFGGQEASIWDQVVLQEELWAHNEPRGGQYMGVNWVGPAIMRFGTEEQQRQFLPPIAAGEMQWAQMFSEPNAGSDLGGIACRAIPHDDHFVVSGQKIWISYADIAQYGFLVARSDPRSRRREGLSVLLVDMSTPGVDVQPIPSPLGPHRLHLVTFDDASVPFGALLGPLHDGWTVATAALSFERSGSARYARTTRVLGLLERRAEADDPRRRDELARLLAFGRAAELVNYSVVAVKERGEVPAWQSSAARIYNSLYEQAVAALAEEMLGAEVLVTVDDEHAPAGGEIESFVRNAPTATVTAGTYEIQTGIVARRGLDLELQRGG